MAETEPSRASRPLVNGANRVELMREVELPLIHLKLADAMEELRKWLDHHECTPKDFDITKRDDVLVIRIVFAEDEMADAFHRDFSA